MPLRTIGNMYFGAGAFGDPAEAARQRMPSTLMDQYSQEELERMGRDVQSRLRNPFESRSGITQQFQQNLATDVAQRRDQGIQGVLSQFDQQGQFGEARPGGLLSPEAGPQGAPAQDPRGLMGITGSREGQPQGDGRAEPPWARMAQQAQGLLDAGFIEEGTALMQNATRMADMPNWEQERAAAQQQQQREQQVYGALDSLEEQGAISPERAALLRARPLEEIEQALFESFNLAPGAARFNQMGDEIAMQPTTAMQEQQAGIVDDDGYSLAIQRIMDNNPGVTREQAANIHTGVVSVRQDPQTGRNFLVNQATGEQTPIRGTQGEPSMPEGRPALTPEDFRLESSLGLTGSWRRPVNAVSDFFTGEAVFPDTQKTNTALSQIRNDVTALIADKFSGRVSEQRLQLIQDAFTINPNELFSGQSQARQTLEQTRNQLERLAEDEAVKLRDPFAYPASEVSDARNTVQQLANRVADIDVILGRTQPQQTPMGPGDQTPAGQQGGMSPEDADAAIQRILGGQ